MNNMGNKRSYNPNNNLQNQKYAGNKQGYVRNNYAPKNESRMSNSQKKSDNQGNQVRVNLRQTGDMGLVKEKGPARQKRQGGYASNIYGSISTTVQKKFNNVLYKDVDNKERNADRKPAQNRARKNNSGQNKRFSVIDSKSSLNKDREGISSVQYNRNLNKREIDKVQKKEEVKKYSEDKNIANYEEDVIEVLPKSVFVFITVAVVFVAALILTVANKDKVGEVISGITQENKQVITNDYDEGIDLELDEQGELDSNQEDIEDIEELEELEDADEERADLLSTLVLAETTKNDTDTKTTNKTTNKTTTKTAATTTKTDKVAATAKPETTTKPVATTKPSVIEEEEEEEEEAIEDVEMTFIALSLTGKLYRCSSSYGVFGSESSFKKCSDSYYVETSNMVMVPKSDKNGIWLDVKGAKVIDYVGYKGGEKVQVVKIRLEESDSTVYKDIYAIKDTYIDLGGNYKKKNTSSTCRSIFATEDMTLQKVG